MDSGALKSLNKAIELVESVLRQINESKRSMEGTVEIESIKQRLRSEFSCETVDSIFLPTHTVALSGIFPEERAFNLLDQKVELYLFDRPKMFLVCQRSVMSMGTTSGVVVQVDLTTLKAKRGTSNQSLIIAFNGRVVELRIDNAELCERWYKFLESYGADEMPSDHDTPNTNVFSFNLASAYDTFLGKAQSIFASSSSLLPGIQEDSHRTHHLHHHATVTPTPTPTPAPAAAPGESPKMSRSVSFQERRGSVHERFQQALASKRKLLTKIRSRRLVTECEDDDGLTTVRRDSEMSEGGEGTELRRAQTLQDSLG
eukprot:c20394_g2_i4.p1 GENE.c20394_g2_i4~~c20394_g2_i4.p1  ORF type:complete len:315 (-),score=81.11 c20394_g2_i4:120-1064(-)